MQKATGVEIHSVGPGSSMFCYQGKDLVLFLIHFSKAGNQPQGFIHAGQATLSLHYGHSHFLFID